MNESLDIAKDAWALVREWWAVSIPLAGLIVLAFRKWLQEMAEHVVPSPQRALLAARNVIERRGCDEGQLSVVLCWLDDDYQGRQTRVVENAFLCLRGVRIVRSARAVRVTATNPDWSSDMLRRSCAILSNFDADLAIVGSATEKTLRLWFIAGAGDGTLHRGDTPPQWRGEVPEEGFREELGTQLAAVAFAALSLCRSHERRDRVHTEVLERHAKQIGSLLSDASKYEQHTVAQMRACHGLVLSALGERRGHADTLRHAVDEYEKALDELGEDDPDLSHWNADMGQSLLLLAGWEQHPVRHQIAVQAVRVCRRAVDAANREERPLAWARAQHALGVALTYSRTMENVAVNEEAAAAALGVARDVFLEQGDAFNAAVSSVWYGMVVSERLVGSVARTFGTVPGQEEFVRRARQVQDWHRSMQDALKVISVRNAPLLWAMATMQDPLFALAGKKQVEQVKSAAGSAGDPHAHALSLEVGRDPVHVRTRSSVPRRQEPRTAGSEGCGDGLHCGVVGTVGGALPLGVGRNM